MFRFAALILVAASVACGQSPTSPSLSQATHFEVVDASGAPLSDISVCPGDNPCVVTSPSGRATVELTGEASVRFRQHDQTLGGLMIVQPGSSNRVVLR